MKKCSCVVTQDGECDACRTLASTAGVRYRGVFDEFILSYEALQVEFERRIRDIQEKISVSGESFGAVGSCERCQDKYIDFAISKIVSGLQGGMGEKFATLFVKNIRKKFSDRGIKKFPLTEKALSEKKSGPTA